MSAVDVPARRQSHCCRPLTVVSRPTAANERQGRPNLCSPVYASVRRAGRPIVPNLGKTGTAPRVTGPRARRSPPSTWRCSAGRRAAGRCGTGHGVRSGYPPPASRRDTATAITVAAASKASRASHTSARPARRAQVPRPMRCQCCSSMSPATGRAGGAGAFPARNAPVLSRAGRARAAVPGLRLAYARFAPGLPLPPGLSPAGGDGGDVFRVRPVDRRGWPLDRAPQRRRRAAGWCGTGRGASGGSRAACALGSKLDG